MQELLHRLQRVKMALACLLLIVSGVILLVANRSLARAEMPSWIGLLPVSELGGLLVGAGLLGVWLDHVLSREKDAEDELRLRRLLHEQAPAMRDAVLEAFAANHEDLKRLATPELLSAHH